MEFESQFNQLRNAVETAIQRALPPAHQRPASIHRVMHYCLEAGGKRLRPVLLLAAAQLFPRRADPLPAAAAIEILHTYTLVHDDLPCMDDSPLRRGRASAHIEFGETLAVLAGDALLTLAFETLTTAYTDTPDIGLELTRLLAEAAGSRRLIAGQVEDTLAESIAISAEDLDFIHLNKTAALIEASLLMGLTVTEHPPAARTALLRAGRAIGLAFQVMDDILDVTSTEAQMGKTVRADAANAKNTHVRIHGIEASRSRAHQLTSEALDALASLDADTTFLATLLTRMRDRLN